MKCPSCSELNNRVIDSRLSKEGNVIRRRRECLACDGRFTTYERVEEVLPMVVKKDGRREPFDRRKIAQGVQKACEKRPISVTQREEIVNRVERAIQMSGEKEIRGYRIGERVMRELHEVDEVAYVRFASVYRSFKDISEFRAELDDLLSEKPYQKKLL